MDPITLTWHDGRPALVLPHGRKGTPAPYPVRRVPGGAVLTSPAGKDYRVTAHSCTCKAWEYARDRSEPCKHMRGWRALETLLEALTGAGVL